MTTGSLMMVERIAENRQNEGIYDNWQLNEGRKYCRMLPMEHSATLLAYIKR